MRIAFAIVGLTAIALGVVACRHEEVGTSHEIHRLQGRLMDQRRKLWDLDVRLGQLTSIEAVRARAQGLDLSLVGPDGLPPVEPVEALVDGSEYGASSGFDMDLRR